MIRYLILSGRSNVEAYEIFEDAIIVKFYGTSRCYSYSYKRAGIRHVENMKALAIRGRGLNSYINLNCKDLYDKH